MSRIACRSGNRFMYTVQNIQTVRCIRSHFLEGGRGMICYGNCND